MSESSWPDSALIRIHPQILLRQVDDEAVLLNLDDGTYYGLDAVGARMMQVLHTSPNVGAALDLLRQEYDVDAVQLRADLGQLLDEMQAQDLVVVDH